MNRKKPPEEVRKELIGMNPEFFALHKPYVDNEYGEVKIEYDTMHNEILPRKKFLSKLNWTNRPSKLEEINENEALMGRNKKLSISENNKPSRDFARYIAQQDCEKDYIMYLAMYGHFEETNPKLIKGEYFGKVGEIYRSFLKHNKQKQSRAIFDEEILRGDSLYEASLEYVRKQLLKAEGKTSSDFPSDPKAEVKFDLDYIFGK